MQVEGDPNYLMHGPLLQILRNNPVVKRVVTGFP